MLTILIFIAMCLTPFTSSAAPPLECEFLLSSALYPGKNIALYASSDAYHNYFPYLNELWRLHPYQYRIKHVRCLPKETSRLWRVQEDGTVRQNPYNSYVHSDIYLNDEHCRMMPCLYDEFASHLPGDIDDIERYLKGDYVYPHQW